MDWWWWIKNLLHIETLFFIMLFVFLLYFLFGGKHRRYYMNQLKNIADTNWGSKKVEVKKKINKSEEKCRKIFEDYFNKKFESIRPEWLKNPETMKNLELDGFNPSIKTRIGKGLAFEYDGAQHAYFTPAFHKTEEQFKNQVRRDIWKDRRCKELGISLIRIPHTVPTDHLASHILDKLRSVGL